MGTPIDTVYDSFFSYIEEDDTFFQYYKLSPEEAWGLAKQRTFSYLTEAISFFKKNAVDIDINIDINENKKEFNDKLNSEEVDLLGQLCFLQYLKRDLVKMKTRINMFSSSDIKVLYSPANERNSYMEMVSQYEENCKINISRYASRNRDTGKFKSINVF